MILKTSYPVIVNDKVIASAEAYEGGFLNASGEDILGMVEDAAKKYIKGRKKQSQQNATTNPAPTTTTTTPAPTPTPTPTRSAPQGYVLTDGDRKDIKEVVDMIGDDGLIEHMFGLREDVRNGSPSLMMYTMDDVKQELAVFEAYAKEKGWTEEYMRNVVVANQATRTAENAKRQYSASQKAYQKIKRDRIAISTLSVISVVLAATTIYLLFNKKATI